MRTLEKIRLATGVEDPSLEFLHNVKRLLACNRVSREYRLPREIG